MRKTWFKKRYQSLGILMKFCADHNGNSGAKH